MTNCVRCRDCKFWMISSNTRERLKEHPVDIKPNDDWIDGVCDKLLSVLDIETFRGDWAGTSIETISTTANFGCVVGQQND